MDANRLQQVFCVLVQGNGAVITQHQRGNHCPVGVGKVDCRVEEIVAV